MTITGPSTGTGSEVVEHASPAAEPAVEERIAPPRARAKGWRAWLAAAVLAVVVAALLVALFEGPVARQWYRTRQDHLASDLAVPRSRLRAGQAAGVLQIPRLGINVVVIEGDSPQRLRGAPGHRIGTPIAGRRGNSVIVGHRSGWGAPFGKLSRLRRGDLIVVQDRDQRNVVFKVTTVHVAASGDVRPLAGSTDHRVTLITSAGGTRTTRRLVVTAVSGKQGRLRAPRAGSASERSGGSPWRNRTTLLALLVFGLALGAYLGLRRRHHAMVVAVLVGPLAAVGVLYVLLNLDLLLPALR